MPVATVGGGGGDDSSGDWKIVPMVALPGTLEVLFCRGKVTATDRLEVISFRPAKLRILLYRRVLKTGRGVDGALLTLLSGPGERRPSTVAVRASFLS